MSILNLSYLDVYFSVSIFFTSLSASLFIFICPSIFLPLSFSLCHLFLFLFLFHLLIKCLLLHSSLPLHSYPSHTLSLSYFCSYSLSLFSLPIPLIYFSLLIYTLFSFSYSSPISYLITFYSYLLISPNFTSPSVRSFMLSQKSAAVDLYQIILPKYAEYIFFLPLYLTL